MSSSRVLIEAQICVRAFIVLRSSILQKWNPAIKIERRLNAYVDFHKCSETFVGKVFSLVCYQFGGRTSKNCYIVSAVIENCHQSSIRHFSPTVTSTKTFSWMIFLLPLSSKEIEIRPFFQFSTSFRHPVI